MKTFQVNKTTFVNNFINPLSQFDLVDNSSALMSRDKKLIGVTHSQDRSIILEATIKNLNGDEFDVVTLKHLPKFKTALGFISDDNPHFTINDNFIEHRGDDITIKSYYLDNRFFDSKQIDKLGKIQSISFDFNFILTQQNLAKIRKSKQASPSVKLYFDASQKSGVSVTRKDDERVGIDTIGFKIADSFMGSTITNVPIHSSIFDLISEQSECIVISYNKQYGLITYVIDTEQYQLYYVSTILKK